MTTVSAGEDGYGLFEVVSSDGNAVAFIVPTELRDAGVKLVEDASDGQSIAVVDQAIRVVGETYGEVNANLVRGLLPSVQPNLLPARFLAAAKRGDLVKIGYVPATHAAGHGRVIAHWRWVRRGD